jgi:hypothetical protein
MIKIDGLTLEQVKMLDHMWSIDSYEDLLEWQQSLSYKDRQMSETLLDLATLADLDDILSKKEAYDILSNKETHIDADNLISKIKKAIKQ